MSHVVATIYCNVYHMEFSVKNYYYYYYYYYYYHYYYDYYCYCLLRHSSQIEAISKGEEFYAGNN